MLDIDLIIRALPLFVDGFWITLQIVGIALIVGGVLSMPLAIVRVYNVPWAAQASYAYSYFFRGTPLLMQVYLLYYGVSQFDLIRDSWAWAFLSDAQICLFIAFSLNSAAYMSEIIRGALASISKGEIEAARAIGMSEFNVVRYVTMPGALRRAIPPLSNEVIFLLHASVIASTITVVDLLGAGRQLNARYYVVFEGLLTAALFYLALTLAITFVTRFLEKRYAGFLK